MLENIKHIKSGENEYPIAFTLNVMEEIQDKFGSMEKWGMALTPENGEPNIKDLKWTFTQFINEGIDIENEKQGEKRPFVTEKQVGRIITGLGMENVSNFIFSTTRESTNTGEIKNEMTK